MAGSSTAGSLLAALEAQPLPRRLAPEEHALKYDVYLAFSNAIPSNIAAGLTWNARWSSAATDIEQLERIYDPMCHPGARYPWHRLSALAPLLTPRPGTPAPMQTLAAAFEGPLPRLKVYAQEDRWGSGLCRAVEVEAVAAELDLALPGWIGPQAPVPVVAMDLHPDGRSGLRLYLGAGDPDQLAAGAAAPAGMPPEAADLAARLRAACPLPGGWHYLTVRLGAGPPRLAINRIYNPIRDAFTTADRFRACWGDALSLLRWAGQEDRARALVAALRANPRLRAVPSATALSLAPGGAPEADLYLTAWELPA